MTLVGLSAVGRDSPPPCRSRMHVLASCLSPLTLRLILSRSLVSDSLRPRRLSPTRDLCPWDFPGKNTGVGCYFLLPRIFLTQGLNLHFLNYRHILYHWATREDHLSPPWQFNREPAVQFYSSLIKCLFFTNGFLLGYKIQVFNYDSKGRFLLKINVLKNMK